MSRDPSFRRTSVVLLVAVVTTLAATLAEAQCTQLAEARALKRSVMLGMRCNYKILRSGPDTTCRQSPPPACAGTLAADALALAYGPNNPPSSSVDRRVLKEQLKCQKRVGRASAAYASKKLSLLIKGVPPDVADEKARRQLERLPEWCGVTVAEDASGVVLPASGPQCAAALGQPSGQVETEQLRYCLHTLLEVWVDRSGPDPQPLRPNIVFILTDDQRWDTIDATHSPFGTDVMPLVRAELGGSGIEFTSAFMTTPLCCPSRASILMGQYAHNTGIYTNKPPNGGAEEFQDGSTLGTWLQSAGYRTGFYGKYMNGYQNLWDENLGELPYVPPGWSEWHVFQAPKFFDYTLIRNGTPVGYGSAEEDYSTDVLRQLAVDFIDSSVASGEPFFLYLNPKAPHLPKEPAPRHVGMFDGLAPWRLESFNEPDVSDKPTWLQNRDPLDEAEIADLDLIRQAQLEMLQAVDEAIGGPELFGTPSIMQALRDNGVADDTIVIYFSDNGWMWGEHRLTKKNCPFDECLRSPMFVRYPRLAPLPRQENRFALNIDLGPTLAALTGATAPVTWDGVSLERVMDGTVPAWRVDFMAEGYRKGRVFAQLRDAEWKYIETIVDENAPVLEVEMELYDLVSDPLELTSVADDPANADRVAAMAVRLREIRPGWPGDGVGTDEDENE